MAKFTGLSGFTIRLMLEARGFKAILEHDGRVLMEKDGDFRAISLSVEMLPKRLVEELFTSLKITAPEFEKLKLHVLSKEEAAARSAGVSTDHQPPVDSPNDKPDADSKTIH